GWGRWRSGRGAPSTAGGGPTPPAPASRGARIPSRPLYGVGVGADLVGAAARGGPREPAWPVLLQLPPWVLLQLMVTPAPAAEIAPTGPPVLVIGHGVVEIGTPGGLAADRAAAGHVPGDNELAQPRPGAAGRPPGLKGP